MFRLSRDLASRRPIELDSDEWYEFSARKSCFTKRVGYLGQAAAGHHGSFDAVQKND